MDRAKQSIEKNPAKIAVSAGWKLVREHPLFAPLAHHASWYYSRSDYFPSGGWATVTTNGQIFLHPTRLGEAEEWAYVIAHCLLHLGFGHFQNREQPLEWNVACDCFVAKFLAALKFGKPPGEIDRPIEFVVKDEESLYLKLCAKGITDEYSRFGTAGTLPDMYDPAASSSSLRPIDWAALLGEGLRQAVGNAVSVAGGHQKTLINGSKTSSNAKQAREWFINSYPMLGALAAAFEIIEDKEVCRRLNIAVAAVDAEMRELYINPLAGLTADECRFIIAHQLLHVGLRHQCRRLGRDPFLWNVACDYVINAWLMEMRVGEFPKIGGLLDKSLQGLSAEVIYDRIVTDLRRYRKFATFRGEGLGDMLDRRDPDWWHGQEGRSLDSFYRECLSQGLVYHEQGCRGLLPLGLIEEIRVLNQPPIPWDVQLARWFDCHIAPLEKSRTYARLSRRQSSTPDIARPAWYASAAAQEGRTYGVILDTSGSMDRKLLAKALGAIASYSVARDVSAVRVIFCDAQHYDQGYISAGDIAGRVKVRGRGGTTLQPAISFLQRQDDFPKSAPLLVITDGYCDTLQIKREHGFLMPAGRWLPFVPRGPVFRIK
jgi:predicted metal-dependent peptidase